MVSEPTELKLVHKVEADEMEAYERLLGDAMAGDPTLFARQDSVEAAWSVVEPILDAATPLRDYAPGSWGPPDAARLTEEVGGWHDIGGPNVPHPGGAPRREPAEPEAKSPRPSRRARPRRPRK
jgi:hypothetical protein